VMYHKQKLNSGRQHRNHPIWVVRAMTYVRVHNNVRQGSVNAKQRSDYAHQNATEAVHATIRDL